MQGNGCPDGKVQQEIRDQDYLVGFDDSKMNVLHC